MHSSSSISAHITPVCLQTDRWTALKRTALIAVSGAISQSPLQFPVLCLVVVMVVGVARSPLRPAPWLLRLGVFRPRALASLGLHLQVGTNAMVLRHSAAEVNDATLVRALV